MKTLYRSYLPINNKNRGEIISPHKKNFKTLKNNTIKSLNDVEYFLNNLNQFKKYFKIYKLLK